jgi:ankyrin repeat protein
MCIGLLFGFIGYELDMFSAYGSFSGRAEFRGSDFERHADLGDSRQVKRELLSLGRWASTKPRDGLSILLLGEVIRILGKYFLAKQESLMKKCWASPQERYLTGKMDKIMRGLFDLPELVRRPAALVVNNIMSRPEIGVVLFDRVQVLIRLSQRMDRGGSIEQALFEAFVDEDLEACRFFSTLTRLDIFKGILAFAVRDNNIGVIVSFTEGGNRPLFFRLINKLVKDKNVAVLQQLIRIRDERISNIMDILFAKSLDRKDSEEVKVFIMAGVNIDIHKVGYSALIATIQIGEPVLMERLFAQCSEEQESWLLRSKGVGGISLLHIAVLSGQPRVCQLLLDRGLRPDSVDRLGNTPLHFAAAKSPRICRILIDAGADVEARRDDGFKPVHVAAREGNEAVFEMLLALGVDIEAVDYSGEGLWHKVAFDGSLRMCELLYRRDPEMDRRDALGERPSHTAAKSGNSKVLVFLLGQGAELNPLNRFGQTPLGVALLSRNESLMEWLALFGADLDVVLKSGETIRHALNKEKSGRSLLAKLEYFRETKESSPALKIARRVEKIDIENSLRSFSADFGVSFEELARQLISNGIIDDKGFPTARFENNLEVFEFIRSLPIFESLGAEERDSAVRILMDNLMLLRGYPTRLIDTGGSEVILRNRDGDGVKVVIGIGGFGIVRRVDVDASVDGKHFVIKKMDLNRYLNLGMALREDAIRRLVLAGRPESLALGDFFLYQGSKGEVKAGLVMEEAAKDLWRLKLYEKIEDPEFCARLREIRDLDGNTLRPETLFLYFIKRALEYIRDIHALDVIHRDIKSENLLLTYDGYIDAPDYGLSSKSDGGRVSGFVGTEDYRAPEIISRYEPEYLDSSYTELVDEYSLGKSLIDLFGLEFELEVFEEEVFASFSTKLGFDLSRIGPIIGGLLREGPTERFSAERCLADPVMREAPELDLESQRALVRLMC